MTQQEYIPLDEEIEDKTWHRYQELNAKAEWTEAEAQEFAYLREQLTLKEGPQS